GSRNGRKKRSKGWWGPHSYMKRTWTLFRLKRPRHSQNDLFFIIFILCFLNLKRLPLQNQKQLYIFN
ncbi:MAG: hypothetical protein N7Q72_02865, partial [Spiroplasma sp. Tabriz.8]|nr:hypothetical protein [Spiroplasma sp. Tabriz.8]